MRRRGMISAGLICSLLLGQAVCLAGCGRQPVAADEVVELIEPTRKLTGSEIVSRRNLYAADVYDVLVDPYVEEYSYEEDRNFLSSDYTIGDMVKAGDVIYRTNLLSAESQIEKYQEKLDSLTESYEEYRREMEETLTVQRRELEVLEIELEEAEDSEPAGSSASDYAAWRRQVDKAQGDFNKKELDVWKNEEALRQRTELYQLDYDYYTGWINDLSRQNANGVLRAGVDGKIINMELRFEGSRISAGTPAVTVADMNHKKVVCNRLNRTSILNMKYAFAFINGKKYEVVYDESEADEYVFELQDPLGEVSVGSYGKLVVYSRMLEQVVTVTNEAIHKSGSGSYVYVLKDGKTEMRTVRIGTTDTVYMEILSGLEEGEVVLLDRSDIQANNTAVLEKGRDALKYHAQGHISYPLQFSVDCDVKHGTIIFDKWPEYRGTLRNGQQLEASNIADIYYAPMKAGDVVAKIKVELSEQEQLELQQKETNLKRLKERLQDYIADGTEGKEKNIASRQAAIDKAQEELDGLYADYNTTEVRVPRDGLLFNVNRQIPVSRTQNKIVERGDEMSPGFSYAYMADQSVVYLVLPDNTTYGTLGCDATLDVSYVNWQGETVIRQAHVVDNKQSGFINYAGRQALLLDKEIVQDMNIYTKSGSDINISNRMSYQSALAVTGEVRVMENVVLLPEKAMNKVSGNFSYVNVLEEDGTIRPTGVLVGGKAAVGGAENYYWVIDGLTEGMTVCWE